MFPTIRMGSRARRLEVETGIVRIDIMKMNRLRKITAMKIMEEPTDSILRILLMVRMITNP